MKRGLWIHTIAVVVACAAVALHGQPAGVGVPIFEVDPNWPKPLPNDWTFGEFAGVAVDSRDHIWINQRPNTLENDEKYLTATPPVADCCRPAPSIMEFDQEGNFVQGWGRGEGSGYEWPENEHGIYVDHKDNVWFGGNGMKDTHILKFTKAGKFLLQVGKMDNRTHSNDPANFFRPAQIVVNPRTNEAIVADGEGNRRVIVLDADTGAYKRHWGAYGNKPDDDAPKTRVVNGPAPQQFNVLHGIWLSRDEHLYLADRNNNRIQVFRPDGTFVKEGFVARQTLGTGTAYDVNVSSDPQQRFVYVADGINNHIWILSRDTLQVLGKFGRQGRYAGQFHHVHSIAVDSKGNVYAAESAGKRVQRFLFKGLSSRASGE